MKKRMLYIILGLALLVSIPFAVKSIREAHYPINIQPSPEWEPFVSQLDVQRESFFVDSDGTKLEAELFIPSGGNTTKSAVVFSPGSGDSLYQNYAGGLVKTYILDLFLSRDIAVLLVNKRGMGNSEGNYVKNSIAGRAADIYAAVQFLQDHPRIDEEQVGVIGHSQGGWVVQLVAAEHNDVAFFISLAGPTTTMRENSNDNISHYGACQGMTSEELEVYIDKRSNLVDISISIGAATNFGMFGFDARNMSYDPRNALKNINSPGLLVYADNDALVTPALNIERLTEIFDHDIPDNFSVAVVDDATHIFHLVNDPCDSFENSEGREQSEQLTEILNTWLTDQGY
jgi:pimeloyl-ACP methyl ester carboxylesterase